MAARYFSLAVQEEYEGLSVHELQENVWPHYVDVAVSNPSIIEWSTFDACIEKSRDMFEPEDKFGWMLSYTAMTKLTKHLFQ